MFKSIYNSNTKFLSIAQYSEVFNNNILAYKPNKLLIVEKIELANLSSKLLISLFQELFSHIEDLCIIRLCDRGLRILKIALKKYSQFSIEKINVLPSVNGQLNQVFIKRNY